jgi:hypothetical protein
MQHQQKAAEHQSTKGSRLPRFRTVTRKAIAARPARKVSAAQASVSMSIFSPLWSASISFNAPAVLMAGTEQKRETGAVGPV